MGNYFFCKDTPSLNRSVIQLRQSWALDSLNQCTTAIPDCTLRAVVNNDITHLQAVVCLSLSCEVLCQVTKSLSTLDTLHSMFYYTSLSACALQTYMFM